MNKYHAKKTSVDNIIFDSKIEADCYVLLKLSKIDFTLQPIFELQEKFKIDNKTIRAIKYIADF